MRLGLVPNLPWWGSSEGVYILFPAAAVFFCLSLLSVLVMYKPQVRPRHGCIYFCYQCLAITVYVAPWDQENCVIG